MRFDGRINLFFHLGLWLNVPQVVFGCELPYPLPKTIEKCQYNVLQISGLFEASEPGIRSTPRLLRDKCTAALNRAFSAGVLDSINPGASPGSS